MGKSLLILLVGFAASFGMLAAGKNRRHLDSVDRAVNQFSNYSANNAAASGAYMALNRLYQDNTWRTGYTNLVIAGDSLVVNVADNTTDSTLSPRRIKVTSIGRNVNNTNLNQVIVFDGRFSDFAIWAKDTVISVTAKDPAGVVDSTLLMFDAPFMPEINKPALTTAATIQSHIKTGSPWTPATGYPNGSFYYSGSTPNVTKVNGDMKVSNGYTVYGIFVIEGNAILEGDANVQGILYLPNTTSTITHSGGSPTGNTINGGVLTWGSADGANKQIFVQYNPTFMNKFLSGYVPENPPLRVLTWQ